MKTYNLEKRDEVSAFCLNVRATGGTLTLPELKQCRDQLSKIGNINPIYKDLISEVSKTSIYLHQLIEDKTPWYNTKPFYIAISGVILTAIFSLAITFYLLRVEQGLTQHTQQEILQKPLQAQDSSKPPINIQNPTLNKTSNTDGGKAASGS
ncbi:hypothetical protein [Thalassolituus oleivorans]|uniref:Uncharacterized protein n=1 Tax=Thalassolituus oleivorans MIL-1 TaxID=1298593 RepID=M5DQ25_9GAMM|nr:hypothetical protein [Thalassolituus oleivorans]CCU71588.1 hypothetical protein TOL_1160 [Thalassolituus oleivorans MIL-1]